ncbi:MAG: 3-dehydroquinate synthase [Nitrospinales bacterium]
MKKIRIDLGDRSYDILIGKDLLKQVGSQLSQLVKSKTATIITHPSINKLYGKTLRSGLEQEGIKALTFEVPEGESCKSIQQAEKLFDQLIENHCGRETPLIALGGGVIGDLTGFVAATFLRGVPYIQIPTTLLSQVDSSVGGKTAVNHRLGKNLIGAFYQPKMVMIDLDTLKSLPKDEFRAGLAEIIKYGIIEDADLFAFLENNVEKILQLDDECLLHIIQTSCSIKAKVVEKDERESRYRMVLNYGHTIGHAIEALTHYKKFKHGEAVAIGMIYAAKLSLLMGQCTDEVVHRIYSLIKKFGFDTKLPDFSTRQYIESMYLDKKANDKKIRFITVDKLGVVKIVDAVLEQFLEETLQA